MLDRRLAQSVSPATDNDPRHHERRRSLRGAIALSLIAIALVVILVVQFILSGQVNLLSGVLVLAIVLLAANAYRTYRRSL